MALVLHSHPLSAYCWKVLIALYENGAPFELRLVNLGDPAAKQAFEALWPTAKIPLLQDDGRVVPETSLQIEHLDRKHPGTIALLPDMLDAQLDVRLWDRMFDCHVMTPMQNFVAQHLRPEAERDARTLGDMQARLRLAYDTIEARMDMRPWAAGATFSMADCAAAPALFYAACVLPFSPHHIKLAAYFERLMARPSVVRVLADAKPFFQYFPLRDALPERFRHAA